jgi:AcrR family transcriptional regulator
MNQPSDRFQQQVSAIRREQILDAAAQVFASGGFHRSTIRDVARAAGVADGTIYNYFANKTALLLGILDRLNQTERREADLGRSAEVDLHRFMRDGFRQRLGLLGAQLGIFQVVLSEVLVDPELRARYVEQIIAPTYALAEPHFARLVQAGAIRPLNMPLALRVISATVLGLLTQRVLGDPLLEQAWDELPDLLTSMLLDGLRAQKEP